MRRIFTSFIQFIGNMNDTPEKHDRQTCRLDQNGAAKWSFAAGIFLMEGCIFVKI